MGAYVNSGALKRGMGSIPIRFTNQLLNEDKSMSKSTKKPTSQDFTGDNVDESAFEELTTEYIKALRAASTNVRLNSLTEVKIIDIKPLGHDKRWDQEWDETKHNGEPSSKWIPCQPVVVEFEKEDKTTEQREYIFRNAETIRHIFGDFDADKKEFSKLNYDNGKPTTIRVPLNVRPKVSKKRGTQYWYELA